MDSSSSLEISVDLGNLPHLLKDLAESVRGIKSQVDQINHAMRMYDLMLLRKHPLEINLNKHESLVLKQSILISEVQSSEGKLAEISDSIQYIQDRVCLLEVQSKALKDSELESSIRIDGVASTTKSLEKVVLDMTSGMKTHSLKMSEMLTAASNSESNWTRASSRIESALSQVEAVSTQSTHLHEQTQILLEDSYSRSASLNKKIEAELKTVDANCLATLSQIRMDIDHLHHLRTNSDDISKVSRMYQRVIGEMRAARIRDSLRISTMIGWRSEALNGSKRNSMLRNLIRTLSHKLRPVFGALNMHSFETSLHIKFNDSVKGLFELQESTNAKLARLDDKDATIRNLLEEYRSGLDACFESVKAIRDRPIEDQSTKIADMIRQTFADIDNRLTETIDSRMQRYLGSTQEIKSDDTQVQEILKDLLILWESIKDVDTKKVDKLSFEEENGVVASQIAGIKADVMSLKNLVDSHRIQSQSASTIATLKHHPNDTLITHESELGGDNTKFDRVYERSKSAISSGRHGRSEEFTKIRWASAKKSSLMELIKTPKQDLHIVAQKIH